MLPREVDLAAEFEVSRGVARETIRAMEERGLVSVKHGKGATIEADDWDVFDPEFEPVVWTEAERAKGQAWGVKTVESFHTSGTPLLEAPA
jgi:DNA-binding FadR family transcriptional regulator